MQPKEPRKHVAQVTRSFRTTARSPLSELSIPLRWRDDTFPYLLPDGTSLLVGKQPAWITEETADALTVYEDSIQANGGIQSWIIPTADEERRMREKIEAERQRHMGF